MNQYMYQPEQYGPPKKEDNKTKMVISQVYPMGEGALWENKNGFPGQLKPTPPVGLDVNQRNHATCWQFNAPRYEQHNENLTNLQFASMTSNTP